MKAVSLTKFSTELPLSMDEGFFNCLIIKTQNSCFLYNITGDEAINLNCQSSSISFMTPPKPKHLWLENHTDRSLALFDLAEAEVVRSIPLADDFSFWSSLEDNSECTTLKRRNTRRIFNSSTESFGPTFELSANERATVQKSKIVIYPGDIYEPFVIRSYETNAPQAEAAPQSFDLKLKGFFKFGGCFKDGGFIYYSPPGETLIFYSPKAETPQIVDLSKKRKNAFYSLVIHENTLFVVTAEKSKVILREMNSDGNEISIREVDIPIDILKRQSEHIDRLDAHIHNRHLLIRGHAINLDTLEVSNLGLPDDLDITFRQLIVSEDGHFLVHWAKEKPQERETYAIGSFTTSLTCDQLASVAGVKIEN